ncbi:hypothetical protein DPQ33_00345 [Oceanidesulfovibrio indonesiensis]|uniref:Nucleoside recognition protein n=1 Tax=Oceanidesulfovibrio indonesiensis TaxID=54767 RepID=A0A7M3MJV9_9BACT|nr:hypothetical protein [Oceanidesulfovibrio indonesiensis]TVM19721.1 hypothetical protein DPQ33_00345 [Oceanidesulfovibrio indonesiensis]
MDIGSLWSGLGWPLIRLLFFVSLGLFVANVIEALNWTRAMARLAQPLVRLGHMKDITGASFSMAFFSGVAANSMLAEHYDKGNLTTRELVLANLFNSLPTYFLHLPTVFFITLPFIGSAAVLYVGLTVASAVVRTAFTVLLGRMLLPPLPEGCVVCRLEEGRASTWKDAFRKAWQRFKKRIWKIATITVPIYIAIYAARKIGFFEWLQDAMAQYVGGLSFLPPEAMSIVVFHVAAEFTAGLAAAGSLMETGTLSVNQIVVALLVGNILSSPMRAFRHQFPYYAGIFKPRLAMRLIVYNQILRVFSLVLVATAFILSMGM